MKKQTWRLTAALVLLFISVGACYQSAATIIDQRRYPAPGRLVDVGGYKLHLHTVGSGNPTVIMDAGLRGYSLSWYQVESALAKTTRVCSYDRAGLGWSDPGPLPRTSQRIVDELHTLLQRSGITGPYVLVGHSFGGLNMRLYASKFPEEVAGLVLIDTPPEELADYFPSVLDRVMKAQKILLKLGRLGAPLGINRLIRWSMCPWFLPAKVQAMACARGFRPPAYDAAYYEIASLRESLQQVRNSDISKMIPTTILIHSMRYPVFGIFSGEAAKAEKLWRDLEMRGSGQKDQNIVIIEGDHNIHLKQPQLITRAVEEMIAEINKKP